MAVIARGNDALGLNPPAGNEQFGTHGSDWLWAVTAVYAISFILFFAASFRPKVGERIFHYIFTITLLVGTISYFALASDIGYKVVDVVNSKPNGTTLWTREILWAKYVYCKSFIAQNPPVGVQLSLTRLQGLLSSRPWSSLWAC
jgi:bacteriorhodopsin